jgi:pimeloyl-ACP methyl ester carboxylesterase
LVGITGRIGLRNRRPVGPRKERDWRAERDICQHRTKHKGKITTPKIKPSPAFYTNLSFFLLPLSLFPFALILYPYYFGLPETRTFAEVAMKKLVPFLVLGVLLPFSDAHSQSERVVDIPSRPGVSQRFLFSSPSNARASVILIAGGHGGLQISPSGKLNWGTNNFVVRNRGLFAERGLMVATLDAPSDRQSSPYLSGFRQTPEHLADVKAVIAWLKQQANIPVWVVGTSRGTQSAAYVAVQSAGKDGGPDGLVLTSTILTDNKGRPVTAMNVNRLTIPTLVVHHKDDGCQLCAYSEIPKLMDKLTSASRRELITIEGGTNIGDPCEAQAYHGFNGRDEEVVDKITKWILQ